VKKLESQLNVKREATRNVQAGSGRHTRKELESALTQAEEMIREKQKIIDGLMSLVGVKDLIAHNEKHAQTMSFGKGNFIHEEPNNLLLLEEDLLQAMKDKEKLEKEYNLMECVISSIGLQRRQYLKYKIEKKALKIQELRNKISHTKPFY